MPQVNDTRRLRARALVERLERGPSLEKETSPKEWTRLYHIWVESWILPEIRNLVPELRKADTEKGDEGCQS
jgi:hypothetical protein